MVHVHLSMASIENASKSRYVELLRYIICLFLTFSLPYCSTNIKPYLTYTTLSKGDHNLNLLIFKKFCIIFFNINNCYMVLPKLHIDSCMITCFKKNIVNKTTHIMC